MIASIECMAAAAGTLLELVSTRFVAQDSKMDVLLEPEIKDSCGGGGNRNEYATRVFQWWADDSVRCHQFKLRDRVWRQLVIGRGKKTNPLNKQKSRKALD